MRKFTTNDSKYSKAIIIFKILANFDGYNSKINYLIIENDILYILPPKQYLYLLKRILFLPIVECI